MSKHNKRLLAMDQQQFAYLLFQGRGRAYLQLQAQNTAAYHETLLTACRYNPVYDAQCEGSRTHYYHELLQLLPDQAWYERELLASLADPDDEMDINQLFELALIFARQGNAAARQVMYENCGAYAGLGWTTGAEELIALDGFDGFLFVAERLGEALPDEPDPWDWDTAYLLYDLEDQIGKEAVQQRLEEARKQRPFVQRYLDIVERAETQRNQRVREGPKLKQASYDAVKQHLAEVTIRPRTSYYYLTRWGQEAADEDIHYAAHDLLQQTTIPMLKAYLAMFHKRPFPLDYQALVPLVWHDDEWVARWTIRSLAPLHAAAIRQLGLELIEQNYYVDEAIKLFKCNMQPGDEQLLATILSRTTDQEELHAVGMNIEDVFEENLTRAAAPLFVELYERGPCSLCRHRFVKLLLDIRSAPDWLLEECRYDVDERTRALALTQQDT